MIKIKSNKLKFRGQKLTELVIFLNAVQHCNGKDIIVELYPYLSEEARKDDTARNHLRHEVFYSKTREKQQPVFVDEANTQVQVGEDGQPVTEIVIIDEWKLLEDLKFETTGHIEFFAQPNFWDVINNKVKEYLLGLSICSETDITEV